MLAGGSAEGTCYQATLLAEVPRDSEFAQVETFGPVASIEVVESADEAVTAANATSYGLASGVITTDPDKGLAIAGRLAGGHRPRERPARARRAPDAVRRRQGQRLGPVRRHVRDGRVHRDAVGDRPERHAAVPVLMRMVQRRAWPRS